MMTAIPDADDKHAGTKRINFHCEFNSQKQINKLRLRTDVKVEK